MARLKVDGYQTISAGILDPNQTIVVVVDMVKGFVSEGAMADPEIARIAPEICQLETYFAHHLYFQDWHEVDCMEFASFPPHCLAHTTESELLDCFKEDARHQTIIRKNSTNGLLAPAFLDRIDAHVLPWKYFVITGCCTDICVMQFALSLLAYLRQHDLNDKHILVPANCVDTYHQPDLHDAYASNEWALRFMQQAGIQVVSKIELKEI